MKFSIEISPRALILMGDWCAPTRDTDRLKTGARNSNDRTLTSCSTTGEEEKILLGGKVCAYLTVRLMGDPILFAFYCALT
jgi:hypothetical protein